MAVPRVSIETVARQFVDAFNRRDVEGMVALSDPEIAFHPSALVGERRHYHGHEGLGRWVADLDSAQFGYRVEVKEVRATERGFLALSEIMLANELVSPAAMLARLNDDGLIVEARSFLTDEETLKQVGWVPDGPI